MKHTTQLYPCHDGFPLSGLLTCPLLPECLLMTLPPSWVDSTLVAQDLISQKDRGGVSL